jgi:tetratricopeptide (TPR) repeat protein
VIAWQQSALANSVLADHSQPGTLEQAVSDLENVVMLEPGWALNHANLGALYLAQGRQQEAVSELEESLQRAPGCGLCALNLGIAQEAAGNLLAAQQAYQQALQNGQPSGAFFWRSTPARRQAQAAWLAEHPPLPTSEAALIAALEANPSSAEPYQALAGFYLDANRVEEAQNLIRRAALAYSGSQAVDLEQAWLNVELLARQGDVKAAVAQGAGIIERYRMTGLYGPGSLGQLYYAPLMFRRPAMALELVPQLARIELPDLWVDRVERMAGWAEQSGDAAMATQLRGQIKALAPDFDE